ncbi:hypothetical protein PVAP13_9NG751954 [Panicum virgatum]|uniref:Uncharacterized protein n=1 Tax=Panicum virgatum TaxID=38727 RepID=A0A8T0N172_PANVG|nr:hypothetical protein PVAP13_9NG751954 [Panicum virgatum]
MFHPHPLPPHAISLHPPPLLVLRRRVARGGSSPAVARGSFYGGGARGSSGETSSRDAAPVDGEATGGWAAPPWSRTRAATVLEARAAVEAEAAAGGARCSRPRLPAGGGTGDGVTAERKGASAILTPAAPLPAPSTGGNGMVRAGKRRGARLARTGARCSSKHAGSPARSRRPQWRRAEGLAGPRRRRAAGGARWPGSGRRTAGGTAASAELRAVAWTVAGVELRAASCSGTELHAQRRSRGGRGGAAAAVRARSTTTRGGACAWRRHVNARRVRVPPMAASAPAHGRRWRGAAPLLPPGRRLGSGAAPLHPPPSRPLSFPLSSGLARRRGGRSSAAVPPAAQRAKRRPWRGGQTTAARRAAGQHRGGAEQQWARRR